MKILHIIYTEGISGAEKHIQHLLPALKKYGWDCELLIICSPASKDILSGFAGELSSAGIKSTVLVSARKFSVVTLKAVNHYLRENGIKTVHSHLFRTDLIISLVKQFWFRKLFIISTKHGYREKVLVDYSPDHFKVKFDLYFFITKYTLSKINSNISISRCISDLFKNLKLTNKFFHVIPHGIDIKNPARKQTSEEKVANGNVSFVIVGRLEKYKGHEYMLAAMPIILKEFPTARLNIIGEGSYRQTLVSLANGLGIADSVSFLGFQKQAATFISRADIVVIPSVFEPFGLVFLEAMALKTPLLAFDVPAGNELLENGTSAFLVSPQDVQQLAAKAIFMHGNRHVADEIAANAFKKYSENYTVEIMAKNTAAFYKLLFPQQVAN